MYFTVKTLLSKGKSQRGIARDLTISRRTVRRIKEQIDLGYDGPMAQYRGKLLSDYHDLIKDLLEKGRSAVLIHEHLTNARQIAVSYPTVVRYVRQLQSKEVFVPVLSDPGEEAQVDFGYLGQFEKDGKLVKTWVFSMVLGHSRYAYYEIVLNQKVFTFIRCHINAFEYFGGVPAVIKIDNLKAGVITPSFYEPIIQENYADFLNYYGSLPVTARIRRPQDKGKVESGVKYAKNNFLRRIDHKDYYKLTEDLSYWNEHICNKRIHGTTRKIPADVFRQVEKPSLILLPALRYEIFDVELRRVNAFGHVAYKYNYYSVPYIYAGETLTVKCNGTLLKVNKDTQQVALHRMSKGQGEYITREEHKPPYKQKKSKEYYQDQVSQIGSNAILFLEQVESAKPRHWHEVIHGIISLGKRYDHQILDLACHRALQYQAASYQTVKTILEKGLYKEEFESLAPYGLGGYSQSLMLYDRL